MRWRSLSTTDRVRVTDFKQVRFWRNAVTLYVRVTPNEVGRMGEFQFKRPMNLSEKTSSGERE